MSKRKPKPVQNKFNPISYLKTGNARKLPIFECLVPEGWEEIKKFPVICARKHVNGNITYTAVLIDLLCTGAKDVIFFVNEPEFFYRDILSRYEDELMLKFEKTSYELVHNIIFESIAFAEDFGIAPSEDFRWAEYILDEDSDDFPRIEIPLGENGKAILYLNEEDERKNYFERQIKAFGEPGTYQIIYNDFDFGDDEDDEFDDEFDDDEEISDTDRILAAMCFNWDKSRWEEFYDQGNFVYMTNDVVMHVFTTTADFSYDLLKKDKLFAPFVKIQSSLDASHKTPMNEPEEDLLIDLKGQFGELNYDDPKKIAKLLKKIDSQIAKNPNLIQFYKLKWEVLMECDELEKGLELALFMKDKFPNEIFSLSCHAMSLAEMDQTDEVPAAMNNFTQIQEFDKTGRVFHLEEVSSFYAPWIWYYSKTNQTRVAFFLNSFLIESGAIVYFPHARVVFDEYMDSLDRAIRPFFKKVKSGKISKKEFVKIMFWD
ncbi:hypothetical protein [Algoriphagus sp.]|uniref:hypothetical protein n=1 Tax=Algoriphagus sp. TaxID=1872435 RepID=UPI0039195AB9